MISDWLIEFEVQEEGKEWVLVDSNIINLIDANNETVAAYESNDTVKCFECQPPIDEMTVLQEYSCDQSSVRSGYCV